MNTSRRKRWIQVVEGVAIGLVILDVALYFGVVRPLRGMRTSAEAEYAAARERGREAKARVTRLEKFKSSVPSAETQVEEFLKAHVPERRQSFSRAAHLVRKLSEDSKVQLTAVSYRLAPGAEDPLARLGLQVEVEGSFPSVMSFAHALETNDEFIALRDFSFEPGENRTIALRVGADLFVRQ